MNPNTQSIVWNDLQHINNVTPFDDNDEACLDEIKAV